MNRRLIPLMVLCLMYISAVPALSAESKKSKNDSGIIYGNNHSFMLTAPNGWVLDNKSGVPNGLHAVLYPVGSSWTNATAVMYANTVDKSVSGNETLDKVIEHDVDTFKKRSQNLALKEGDFLSTSSQNKKATAKHFSGDLYNNYEAVAYIDENKVVVIIVLSAKNRDAYEKSLPSFKELVGSYQFFTEDVRIDKK